MTIKTIESDFKYQMNNVLESMKEEYNEEQEHRKEVDLPIQTFSEWLWVNLHDFGQEVYQRLDEWCGMDNLTQDLNH